MPDRIALIIASNEFDDPKFSRLVAPSQDAQALSNVLEDPMIGGFQTMMLLNPSQQATSKSINRLYQKRRKDDLLLLYYSGHGIKDDYGDLYLAVKDTETDTLAASGIEAAFISRLIDKCQSRRNVIILDCCYSGAFPGSGAKSVLGSSSGTREIMAGSGYGRVVLTASNAVQYAWEGDQIYGHASKSVFTHFLVKGLQTGAADLNQDGVITLDELYDYIYDQVVSTSGTRQTPQKWAQKVEGQLIIARNPSTYAKPGIVSPAPRLSVKLSYIPEIASSGEDIRWTVSLTNQSQEPLEQVEVRHELELLRPPFTILPGKWRRTSFLTYFPEDGDYVVTVEISAVTATGARVYYESSKAISVKAHTDVVQEND